MRKGFLGICIMWCGLALAQEIEVKGGFLTDSLKVGQPVDFYLTARYPASLDVLLPDSTFDFSPFEYAGRQLFDTRENEGQAIDSVVYSLRSFEIDLVQYLRLPGTLYRTKDTLRVFSSRDSIFFQELVPVATDTTALVTDTSYQKVSRQLNKPLVAVLLGALIVIALAVLLIFGKRIRRHFILRRMAKAHQAYSDKMGQFIRELKTDGLPETAEQALSTWKKYQERIEKLPFSKLTSKEIVHYPFGEELREPLRAVDRCVYGKMPSGSVYQDFQHLLDFSEMRYQAKVDELKHGKN